jgi:hypothetical protein
MDPFAAAVSIETQSHPIARIKEILTYVGRLLLKLVARKSASKNDHPHQDNGPRESKEIKRNKIADRWTRPYLNLLCLKRIQKYRGVMYQKRECKFMAKEL